MSRSTVDDYCNTLKKAYQTITELLITRGYSEESVSIYTAGNLLNYKCQKFITEENSSYIDIYVYEKNKTYVKFFSANYKIKMRDLINTYQHLLDSMDMDIEDEIIFIFTSDEITLENKEILIEFENMFSNIRTFNFKQLLYNITKHKLVPEHSLYKGTKKSLFEKLQITSDEQLPYILHQDPICKFYNFKINEIIEIKRNPLVPGLKSYNTYRVVK
tara:strand:- start:43 stop:693 length:651 start_codon:yes stop_codon:yes gene_type:complete